MRTIESVHVHRNTAHPREGKPLPSEWLYHRGHGHTHILARPPLLGNRKRMCETGEAYVLLPSSYIRALMSSCPGCPAFLLPFAKNGNTRACVCVCVKAGEDRMFRIAVSFALFSFVLSGVVEWPTTLVAQRRERERARAMRHDFKVLSPSIDIHHVD